MCTNDENPYLIDTKMYLFHVEYHFGGLVTDLVVRLGNIDNQPAMFWKRRHAGHING